MIRARALLATAALLAAVPARAQEAAPRAEAPPARPAASPLLPAEHWAVRAAWRAEALGLAPGFFPAERGAPRAAVAAALEEAAARAEGSRYAPVAAGWLARFRDEFAEYRGVSAASPRSLAGAARAGYGRWTGRLAPATGLRSSRRPPEPVADRSGPFAAAAATVTLGRAAALHADAVLGEPHAELRRWEAVAAAGGVALSLGRAEVGYGHGRSGGIVLSTAEPLPRLALRTERPFRLPLLGGVTAHTFATRLDDGRHLQRPWLWGARLAVRPHERVSVGVNRAAIFGGDSVRTSFRRVVGMLAGVLTDDFENQVVAVDARWRLPTDRLLPATAYLEWGAEDASGAWTDQPAYTAGVQLPALPGLPWASAGVEATRFAACCAHGAWYTHTDYQGNWARGDALLGHPLGGQGIETTVYAAAEPPRAPVRLDGRVFVRSRSTENSGVANSGNLFAPDASGRGVGGELGIAWRPAPGVEWAARFYRDATGGMREHRAETEIRYRF
jgi:hypothetical protein